MKSKKGFTLTELLVVILIVGVLLSMSTVAAIRHLNKTKNKSAIATAKSYITAVNDYNLISKNEKEDLIVSSNVSSINSMLNESISGQKPKSGYVLVENNKAAYAMLCIDGKTVKYEDKKFSVIDDNCKSSKNVTDLPDIPRSTPEEKPYICKRATTLHPVLNSYLPEESSYGNIGTRGLLASGDAFDCDVNGDEIYDWKTERFYYITDLNKNTAVLIYYSNVTAGVPDNTSIYAYNNDQFPCTKHGGPYVAMLQLPTTDQWKNVKLFSDYRDILQEYNSSQPNLAESNFNYSGRSARLLTTHEYNTVPDNTKLNTFLTESIDFTSDSDTPVFNNDWKGYWLESYGNMGQWFATIYARVPWGIDSNQIPNQVSVGVRPVIEVPKVDIEI